MLKNLFMKYFLIMNIINSSLSIFFISDPLTIWFIMEINNFMFISFINFQMNNKKIIFLYYMLQVIPSFLLILSISLNNINFINNNLSNMILVFSLMMKLGVPPFHYWMILMSNYMPWLSLFLFLTLQKIIPFYLLYIFQINIMVMMIMTLLCSVVPPLFSLNITNFKKILTYSSINQNSWMLILIFLKISFWFMYMLMYTLITFIIFILINTYKISFMYTYSNSNSNLNLFVLMSILNLASLPPFSFFLFKWMSVYIMIKSNLFILIIIMMFSSFMMFYIYVNMMYLAMFLYMSKTKMLNLNYSPMFFWKPILYMPFFFMSLILLMI